MFFRLFSIETIRFTRRAWPWIAVAACALFAALSLENFYTLNQAQLLRGEMKMPGLSFDLANSLDVGTLVALPFLVILSANLAGSDYAQRTHQHWLMRAPRFTGVLAKFAVLAAFTFFVQALTLVVGAGVGWYFKTFVYQSFSLANVNDLAVLAAPFYMTLSYLPYLALIQLITVATRSTLAGVIIGLGYTEFIEILVTSVFHGGVVMFVPHNMATSVSYLLNDIGNRVVEIPAYLAQPTTAMIGLFIYTLVFLGAAVWLYSRQDIAG